MATKPLPCPKCGSTNVKLHDCGYSAFNVASGDCLKCKFSLSLPAGTFENQDTLAKSWNKKVRAILKEEAKKSELQKLRSALKEAEKLLSEFAALKVMNGESIYSDRVAEQAEQALSRIQDIKTNGKNLRRSLILNSSVNSVVKSRRKKRAASST